MRILVRSALACIALCLIVQSAAGVAATPNPAQSPQVRALGDSVVLDVKHVSAAGTDFAWAELGSGAPLLLLNGTGSTMSEWDPAFLDVLSRGNRVIVFDYPGLGQSGPAPSRISFGSMAEWISAFMSAIGVPQAHVLGWSMGGFVAQRLVHAHPGQVSRLILAATNPGGHRAVLGPKWVQHADSDPNAGDLTYLRTNYPHTHRAQQAGRDFLRRLARAVNSGRYPPIVVPNRTYNAMVRAENSWLRSDTNFDELSGIGIPVLVATGKKDWVAPPRNSRVIAQRIPGSQLALYKGAGHSFLFQKHRRVASDFSAFLNGA